MKIKCNGWSDVDRMLWDKEYNSCECLEDSFPVFFPILPVVSTILVFFGPKTWSIVWNSLTFSVCSNFPNLALTGKCLPIIQSDLCYWMLTYPSGLLAKGECPCPNELLPDLPPGRKRGLLKYGLNKIKWLKCSAFLVSQRHIERNYFKVYQSEHTCPRW